MNVKKFLPLIAAAGLGLVALIIAHSGLGRSSGADKGDKSIHVVVAKENVAPGQQLTADNLMDQVLGASTVPPTAYTNMSDVINRVTVAPMVAGQPVLKAFLAAPGALSGLNALVPPGMRAVTIDVNETTGLAGLIQPGSRVDLVSVINQGEHDKSCARTIASNVPVVAVGTRMTSARAEGDTSIAHTVTLLAKPKEAELIKLATLSANTSLMLRGNGDEGPADAHGVQFSELLGPPMTTPQIKVAGQPGEAAPSPVRPVGQPTTQHSSATRLPMVEAEQPQHMRRIQMILGTQITNIELPDGDTDALDTNDDYTGVEQEYIKH